MGSETQAGYLSLQRGVSALSNNMEESMGTVMCEVGIILEQNDSPCVNSRLP